MDNIISVWNYREEKLKGVLEHLNFWGDDLKFTTELEDDKKLPFLDVLLFKNENSLNFKIYENLLTIIYFCCSSPVMLAK